MHFRCLVMRSPIPFRSLLATAVAITFSHATAVEKRQGYNCGEHFGKLQVLEKLAPYDSAGAFNTFGWIGTTSGFNGLFVVQQDVDSTGDEANVARFRFTGCQDGPSVNIMCTNCEEGGYSVIGSYPTAHDAYGEPNRLEFMNFGLPDTLTTEPWGGQGINDPGNILWPSKDFTYGADGLIRPVTWTKDDTNQGLLYDAWCPYDACTTFQWERAPIPGFYFQFLWQEIS